MDSARNTCVLGSGLATDIFPNSSPVGEPVKIDGINYTVVGVLAPKGSALGGDEDNFAVVPITTGLNRYGHWYRSLNILVQARDRVKVLNCSINESFDEISKSSSFPGGTLRMTRNAPRTSSTVSS